MVDHLEYLIESEHLDVFAAALQANELFHLHVPESLHMLHHVVQIFGHKVAQMTAERLLWVLLITVMHHGRLPLPFRVAERAGALAFTHTALLYNDEQMLKDHAHCVVSHLLRVQGQFLYGVRVKVAAVALQLDHIGGQLWLILQLEFVPGAALADVIDEIELLQVLVGLAVQLKVGL